MGQMELVQKMVLQTVDLLESLRTFIQIMNFEQTVQSVQTITVY